MNITRSGQKPIDLRCSKWRRSPNTRLLTFKLIVNMKKSHLLLGGVLLAGATALGYQFLPWREWFGVNEPAPSNGSGSGSGSSNQGNPADSGTNGPGDPYDFPMTYTNSDGVTVTVSAGDGKGGDRMVGQGKG